MVYRKCTIENPELTPEITTNDTSTSDTNTKEENQTDQTDSKYMY
jgi:hypothetical protein